MPTTNALDPADELDAAAIALADAAENLAARHQPRAAKRAAQAAGRAMLAAREIRDNA